jgi:aminoglycoside phosphotransferase (APT) family kinase protein
VTEFLGGVRGDVVLSALDETGRAVLGERLGRIAGTLSGMPQLRAGSFADPSLRVEPFPTDLEGWVEQHAGRLGWPEQVLEGLRSVAAEAQDRLDAVERVSLVHSDLNPKNVLVDPDTLEVTGVLDWEFAHAGHPHADLGNLLRFDRDEAYAAGVLRGFTAVRGGDPESSRDLARCADLFALVDLAARRDANPVAARAHELLGAIARARDVHATPAATPQERSSRGLLTSE